MNLNLLQELISAFDTADPHFRPTELFNESWLIKLVLHHASTIPDVEFPLGFMEGSTWFSEGLLPTAFRPRKRGDPLGEGRTNADGIIGHILIGKKGKADLELQQNATQFTVVEAKIGSSLSAGTSNARGFDQAARSVACMAEAMACASVAPSALRRLDFVLLAPSSSIEDGVFGESLARESIGLRVEERVRAYGGKLDQWFEEYFRPTLAQIRLCSVSWETALEWISAAKPASAAELLEFYRLYLDFS